MLRLWHQRLPQLEIAAHLGLDITTVTTHLRKLFGVETPAWEGKGRVSIRRARHAAAIPKPVIYPPNPPRLEVPNELYSGEAARFWSHVAAPNEFGCRLWLASVNSNGYGQFGVLGGNQRANRVSWRLTYGEIPLDRQINHRCDIRSCVEPEHFWLGTQIENMHDKVAKGRSNLRGKRGDANVRSKLTWDIVREMRRVRETKGLALYELAEMFGISTAQCSNICAYKQWIE